MKRYQIPLILFIATIMAQLPIWANVNLFLLRGNDLENFFWPIFIIYKKSLLSGNGLPLWNPLWFGGQPLIADPQSLLFYPGQILFLILPIPIAIISSLFIHSLLSVLFAYKVSVKYFSSRVAAVVAILYVLSSKLAAAIEAGHFGIILAWAWIPAVLYFALNTNSHKIRNSVLLAVSSSFLFQSHTVTTLVVLPFIYIFSYLSAKNKRESFIFLLVSGLLFMGFTAPVLLPQVSWQTITTRYLLLSKPEIYPVWLSKFEFLSYLFPEYNHLSQFNTEKVIALGIAASFVAILGWTRLEIKGKITSLALVLLVTFLALNNVSPVSFAIVANPFLQIVRVTTRFWPIFILVVLFLVGKGLQTVKHRLFFIFISVLCIGNTYFLYLTTLAKIPNIASQQIPDVYRYISQDNDTFRVYCTDRCIGQKEAATHSIEIIDGYATLTQKNYYQKSWSLFGGYWDYYTLAIPPFGVAESGKLKPNFDNLGEMNVKYVISPIKINSSDLSLASISNGYHIYINKRYRPRAYVTDSSRKLIRNALLSAHGSNTLEVRGVKPNETLIFSTIYSPGWYANGKPVAEAASNIMSVNANADRVVFQFMPKSFTYGVMIFFGTVFLLLVGFFSKWLRFSKIFKTTHKSNVS